VLVTMSWMLPRLLLVDDRLPDRPPAMGPAMTSLAGELADGLIARGFTAERYLRDVVVPALVSRERVVFTIGVDSWTMRYVVDCVCAGAAGRP